MDKELHDALVVLLKRAIAGINDAADQIPVVVHEMLVWKSIYSLIMFLSFAAMTFIFAWLAKRYWDKKKSLAADSVDCSFASGFCAIFSASCFIVALNWLDWLAILVAPKFYLVQYLSSLAK